MSLLVLVVVIVVNRLAVNLQETVELHHFAAGHELLVAGADADGDGGLLYLGICHLAGQGALPDEVIQALLLYGTLNRGLVHIGRTDGFVSLLGTL